MNDSAERQKAMEKALEAVLLDVLAAERELAAVQARLHNAREAASGLQGLVGPDRSVAIAEAVGARLQVRRAVQTGPSAEARRAAMERDRDRRRLEAVQEHQQRRERELRGRVDVSRAAADAARNDPDQATDDLSSTERVIAFLREHEGKALHRADILRAFEDRGWIDPDWSHPSPAIRMAIRRAVEKGAVKQVGDDRYLYNDPDLLPEGAMGGDG